MKVEDRGVVKEEGRRGREREKERGGGGTKGRQMGTVEIYGGKRAGRV